MKRRLLAPVIATLLLFCFILGNLRISNDVAPPVEPNDDPSGWSKVDSKLGFLLKARDEGWRLPYGADELLSSKDFLQVTVMFSDELTREDTSQIETLGASFLTMNGEIAHVGPIYLMDVPLDRIGELSSLDNVVQVDSTLHIAPTPPLDVGVPEIYADEVWEMLDGLGRNITGKGVVIADLDTGVDVVHPGFFKTDGGEYDWIDVNINLVFDPALDAVDLNGNGTFDTGENLNFFDGVMVDLFGGVTNDDGIYGADTDWLYNDANTNSQRDYGTGAGFTESSPTYGERLFLLNDTNGNLVLDVGEKLIGLNTSKILRTWADDGVDRTRGVDLISTNDDEAGHGTGVSGILNMGTIGQRFVGVAPDAEIMVADGYTNGMENATIWAASNGADVILYEYAPWTWEFLDGSSNLEQMLDINAVSGIIQVVAAGNLAGASKHSLVNVGSLNSEIINFNVPFPFFNYAYPTILWLDGKNELTINLTTPAGGPSNTVTLAMDGTVQTTSDGHEIYSNRTESLRGTAKVDLYIQRSGGTAPISQGTWSFEIFNAESTSEDVHIYMSDDLSGWSQGVALTTNVTDSYTVCSPATADSAISVGSHSTRDGPFGAPKDELSSFSSRGPRIDGAEVIDVTAPGDQDLWSSAPESSGHHGAYRVFGGTSGAAPFVTATTALMLQANSSLSSDEIKQLLRQTARSDSFTGTVPNFDWGYGKLNASLAIKAIFDTTVKPPKNLDIALEETNGKDVNLTWELSDDDGAGEDDIDVYEIYTSTSYDKNAFGYGFLASVPKGQTYYIDVDAGRGDIYNYYYIIMAVDDVRNRVGNVTQLCKYVKKMDPGKNLISMPFVFDEMAIDKLLQGFDYNSAWWYDPMDTADPWKSYNPSKTNNDLLTVNYTMALWIDAVTFSTLTSAGRIVQQVDIPLKAGWNLVGYPSQTKELVLDAFSGVLYERIETHSDVAPQNLRTLISTDLMHPGNGYWIKVPSDTTWTVYN